MIRQLDKVRRRRPPMSLAQKLARREQAMRQKCPDCGALRPTLRGNVGEYGRCTKCAPASYY